MEGFCFLASVAHERQLSCDGGLLCTQRTFWGFEYWKLYKAEQVQYDGIYSLGALLSALKAFWGVYASVYAHRCPPSFRAPLPHLPF